jgi:hypothetical protein
MPHNPLAIDLFCGLFEPEFFARAYFSVKKLVAGWAQYPNHVRLSVASQSPSPISLELWAMSNLKDTRLSTSLACLWHIGVSAAKSIQGHIFEFASSFISWSTGFIFSPCPYFTQVSSGRNGAFVRAISSVGVRRKYIKMLSTSPTVTTRFCNVSLLSPASAPNTTLATK